MAQILTYTGKTLANGDKDGKYDAYIPSEQLVKAVNITLFLQNRPLLLMGEPGVGKSRLAESVAYELLGPEHMNSHFFKWHIKSTTKAKDGLYRYDTFKRLADAQLQRSSGRRSQMGDLKLGAKNSYIQPGVLALALSRSTETKRCVLLIDEIDKADIDFPNDLLNELENQEFTITETGETIEKKADFAHPIIIITSNRERDLPPAFLRRCLYHYIKFPEERILRDIISKVFSRPETDDLIRKTIAAFIGKREMIQDTEKKPSTSELLDWFRVLDHVQQLKDENPDISQLPAHEQALIKEIGQLDNNRIPFAEVLLKTYESYNSHQNA